jgi:hypothetical protein
LAITFICLLAIFCWLPVSAVSAQAADPQTLTLPFPVKTGGLPLNDALNKRHSDRKFQAAPLSLPQISQILWSAFGVNREASSMRTIPTAHNRQNLAVYAVLPDGVWLYDAAQNQLTLQLAGNFTSLYGESPLTLLYAAPISDGVVGGLHAGSAYQSVGLYCASEGLANVVKTTGIDALLDKLTLIEGYKVLVVQSIGQHPAEE